MIKKFPELYSRVGFLIDCPPRMDWMQGWVTRGWLFLRVYGNSLLSARLTGGGMRVALGTDAIKWPVAATTSARSACDKISARLNMVLSAMGQEDNNRGMAVWQIHDSETALSAFAKHKIQIRQVRTQAGTGSGMIRARPILP